MNFLAQTLKVAKWPLEPLFKVRFARDTQALNASFKQVGVLQPVLLYQTPDQLYILDGLSRTEYLKQTQPLDFESTVLIAHHKEVSELQALWIYLFQNQNTAVGLNEIEKINLVLLWAKTQSHQDETQKFLLALGFQPHQKISELQSVLNLPESLLNQAVRAQWPLWVLLKFLAESSKDISLIFESVNAVFKNGLNANKWSYILDVLKDLRAKEKQLAIGVLNKALEKAQAMPDEPQKEKVFRDYLNQKRNPRFEAQNTWFNQEVQALSLGSKIKVAPTPFFEDEAVHLTAKLDKKEDLQKLVAVLNHPAWQKILSSS